MSDTPETDAEIRRIEATYKGHSVDAVLLHFARSLERRLQDANKHITHLAGLLREAEGEADLMRRAIAWANNSLYGSHGFFLSDRGDKAPHEHHLDIPIEALKAYGNAQWHRAEAAERKPTPEEVQEACAAIPDEWLKHGSCGMDGPPCTHIRMASEISGRIRALGLTKIGKEKE